MYRLIRACVAAMAIFHGGFSVADAQESELFEMVAVSDGVYAAIAQPTYKLNGNAAVIINEADVVVVDTHSTPSSAESLIKQIGGLTDKPIRYVINTHFHYDHARGNAAYVHPYPHEVTLISTMETRRGLIEIETDRVRRELDQMPATIGELKHRIEESEDPQLHAELQQAEAYYGELRDLQIVLPTVTFDHSLVLHREAREIYILFLGRGHTAGDAVVYLPAEEIVVTGDLVTTWVPGTGDGYPQEWIQTLEELEKLRIARVIGGHGPVTGPQTIRQLKEYLRDVVAEVTAAAAQGADLGATQQIVFDRLAAKHATRFPRDGFEARVRANIADVYRGLEAVD